MSDDLDYLTGSFAGTARYYLQYRVPYPQELIDHLRSRLKFSGEGMMLDLACGPGRFPLRMHRFFREIWALDREEEMIQVVRESAGQAGVTSVRWLVGRAEELEAPSDAFELVTVGSAFHRLDRKRVMARALQWLTPGGAMVVMGCNAAWKGGRRWQHVVAEIIAKWMDKPMKGSGIGERFVPYGDVLAAGGFVDIEHHRFPTPHTWTLDAFIGYMYSTAKASKASSGETCTGL